MKRGIAALIALFLVLSGIPFGAVAGAAQTPSDDGTTRLALSQSEPLQQSTGTPQTSTYATGRPVDDVSVESDGDRLSLLVTDDNPEGTPLVLDRDWLSDELGKSVTLMRFHLEGELVDSYKLTEEDVIIDIPHFSTQNVTVTTVDGQFQVDGSASGQETTRVINYDVNETGIAILAIEGSGTREGEQRVDQFYSQVDNSTFQWETGEIPRNVTLKFTGQGSKLGPAFNESLSGVSNGETGFFDLTAKDYEPNLTVVGAGEKNGTLVEKGAFRNQSDGDTQTLTFNFRQNNESVVFIGNTSSTTSTTSENANWESSSEWDNAVDEKGVVHESTSNTDHNDAGSVKKGYSASSPPLTSSLSVYYPLHEDSGTTVYDFSGSGNDGTYSGVTLGESGLLGTSSPRWNPSNNPYVDVPNVFEPSNDMSVAYWINFNSIGSDNRIFTTREENGMSHISNIGRSGSNTLGLWVSGTDHAVKGSLTTGKWYFVAYSYDASTDQWVAYVGSLGSGFNQEASFIDAPGTGGGKHTAIGSETTGSGYFLNARVSTFMAWEGRVVSQSSFERLYSTTAGQSFLETAGKSYDEPVSPDSLNLTNVSASIKAGTSVNVTVNSDPDNDGTYEESSDPISLTGSGGPYEVTSLTSESSQFRLNASLTSSNISRTASLHGADLKGESTTTTTEKTKDPAIDVDGDGTNEASYVGTLNDSEVVVVDITENVTDGTQTWSITTSNGSTVDWKYQGNNEARAHVENFSVNGMDYPVDQFLAEGETTTVPIDNLDTIQGTNSLTLNTYTDTETTQVSRIDVGGRYEGRTVVDNYTVNGAQSNLDATLADGETTSVNISSEAVYGTNNITVELRENSTQDNYDAELVWYSENRTYFTNVSVDGSTYGSPTFLAENETLVLNVTDGINPGKNEHIFRMESEKTTTDTLSFTEKVEFYKNVSVEIEEKHATYNKSSTEAFEKQVTAGTQFNFSVPDRVLRHASTTVVYNDTQTGIGNTTEFTGGTASVEVTEEIPNGTEVSVKIKFVKYRLQNADDVLRGENTLSEPYRVNTGVSSVTDDVVYETTEVNLTESEWEVVLTQNGDPTNEITANATFSEGNVTIPESYFDSAEGFIVQRPRYSTVTYTGTVNTIYPSPVLDPNRTVTHDPTLHSEPDETYVPVEQYSVTDLSSPFSVEWKQVGPYHLQWITNESGTYNQTIENVSTEGVSVFASGDRYRDYTRESDDLVIHSNRSATWDVYQYDYPEVTEGTDVSINSGQTKTVEIEVHNPNDFTLHNVELLLEHGWIAKDPVVQDVAAGETVTFEVDIKVPHGTQPTTYELPMNVSSVETGEVNTEDVEVAVGGGLSMTAGAPISQFGLIIGGVALFGALILFHLARSGQLEALRRELEKI